MVEDRDIHNFTLAGNWTKVKPLRGAIRHVVHKLNILVFIWIGI